MRARRSESRFTTSGSGRSRDDPSNASPRGGQGQHRAAVDLDEHIAHLEPRRLAELRLTTAPTVGGPSDNRAAPPSACALDRARENRTAAMPVCGDRVGHQADPHCHAPAAGIVHA